MLMISVSEKCGSDRLETSEELDKQGPCVTDPSRRHSNEFLGAPKTFLKHTPEAGEQAVF
jgi:hypothetical protein